MFSGFTPSLSATYLATSMSNPLNVPSGFLNPMPGWSNLMPTISLPPLALVSTWEFSTAPDTALLPAPATELLALDTADPAAPAAALATLCPALATLEAALAIELAGVCGVLLPQPDTTRASAAAPAITDAILRTLMRWFLPVVFGAARPWSDKRRTLWVQW